MSDNSPTLLDKTDVVLYGNDKKCFFCGNETKETNYYKHSLNFDGRDFVILLNSHSSCLRFDDVHLHTLNACLALNQSCIICDKEEQEKQFVKFLFPNNNFGIYIGRECGCKSLFYHYMNNHYMNKIKSDIFNKLNAANTLLGKTEDLVFQCGNIERVGIHKAILFSRADFQKQNKVHFTGVEEDPKKEKGPTIVDPATYGTTIIETHPQHDKNEYVLRIEKQTKEAMIELSRPYFRKY